MKRRTTLMPAVVGINTRTFPASLPIFGRRAGQDVPSRRSRCAWMGRGMFLTSSIPRSWQVDGPDCTGRPQDDVGIVMLLGQPAAGMQRMRREDAELPARPRIDAPRYIDAIAAMPE